MFALQWAWDPLGNFGTSFATKAQQLRACNSTLFRNMSALRALPTPELSAYLGSCWNYGGALMYPHNSMYAVCVLHALRFFKREQFLFLRYEDLMAMDTASLIGLLGRFTGLYAGPEVVDGARRVGRCQAHGRRGAPSTYATISPEEKVLYNESTRYVAADREALEELFAPYNHLLTDLVGHADFRWD